MPRPARSTSLLAVLAVAASGVAMAIAAPAAATDAPQPVPYSQRWTNPGLITVNDDWNGVPGVIGYLGDVTPDLAVNTDPQTLLTPGSSTVDVIANLQAPSNTGGVGEFEAPEGVVALQGSAGADAPNIVVTVSTVGAPADTTLSYVVRDLDANTDDARQQLAVQYRVGASGNYANLEGGYLEDASIPGATQATPVSLALPAGALGQPVVQFRFITTNATGSDEWLGIDDIAVGPPDAGPALPVASCPATLAADEGASASAVVSATDADSAIAAVAITSASVSGITLTPLGAGSATLTVGGTTAVGTHPVTVTFTTDDAQTTSCTVNVTVTPAAVLTTISAVQGAGGASDMVGRRVIVEAVVTSLFTRADVPDGFFVQEEDDDADSNDATSEGLFVFCRGRCPAALAAGDLVRLTGTVAEFFEMTQIDVTGAGAVELLSSGNERPTPAPVDLPAGGSTKLAPTFEAVEGMVVTFSDELTVAEHFELARYGQLRLTSDGRTHQFTHDNVPNAAGYEAFVEALNARTIILDDDNNDQNDAVTGSADEPYPYPSGGLSTTNDVRAGDTIEDLTGVLHYSFAGQTGTDAWRLRPLPGESYDFAPTNPRPDDPEDVGGRIKVAAFNVLNYFTTIDETPPSPNVGPCGPSATLDCRGADSAAELVRQRAKEVVAIGALDADVVGLVELQNDDGPAVEDLVTALNARSGAARYAALDTGTIGGDAIKVAFIYRPTTVTPIGDFDILDSSDDARFVDTLNRPALTQQFAENLTGERFTASINHLKSKGSACPEDAVPPGEDPDDPDGQGNCSETRTNAAAALADHLAELVAGGWDRDVVILGDLNSYRRETPITTLQDAGYVDLIDEFVGDDAYSYLFDGQLGYLDHAMATPTLAAQVTDVTEWHVNADEVPLFDYNDDVPDAGESSFERESARRPLYAPDERRSSDHDPLLVGLDLASLTIDDAAIVQAARGGGTLAISGTTGTPTMTCPTLRLTVDGQHIAIGRTRQIGRTTVCVALTSSGLATFDRRTGAFAGVLALPVTFRLSGDDIVFVLAVDGTTSGVVADGRRSGTVWTTS